MSPQCVCSITVRMTCADAVQNQLASPKELLYSLDHPFIIWSWMSRKTSTFSRQSRVQKANPWQNKASSTNSSLPSPQLAIMASNTIVPNTQGHDSSRLKPRHEETFVEDLNEAAHNLHVIDTSNAGELLFLIWNKADLFSVRGMPKRLPVFSTIAQCECYVEQRPDMIPLLSKVHEKRHMHGCANTVCNVLPDCQQPANYYRYSVAENTTPPTQPSSRM